MKSIKLILIMSASLFISLSAFSQNKDIKKLDLVKKYLNYIKEPNWKFDTLAKKYLLFRSDESPKYSRDQRKVIISFAVSYLSTELKNIKLNEVIIKSYLEADSSMQRMFLKPNTKDNVVIAYTKDKRFLRYFLIEEDKIKSFVTFKQGKIFVLLN